MYHHAVNFLQKMRTISWTLLLCFISITKSSVGLLSEIQEKLNHTYSFRNESYFNDADLIETFKQNYPIKLWKYYGLFKEDFILKINAHWLKFPPPNEKTHYFLAGLYLIIMSFGMFGNALVVFMISR